MNKLLAILVIISITALSVNCGNGASVHCGIATIYALGSYFQTNKCVGTCSGGYILDSNNNCQPPAIPGTTHVVVVLLLILTIFANFLLFLVQVACSGGATADSNNICQPPVAGTSVNCGTAVTARRSCLVWYSSSCACSGGAIADSNNICQPPIPGSSVNCGTAVTSTQLITCKSLIFKQLELMNNNDQLKQRLCIENQKTQDIIERK
ncbi:hypothetical protein ABPG74_019108 [Tetrahymena malaccensis]